MATSTTITDKTTPTTFKPRIRVLPNGRYLVESFTQPGIGHQVDVLRLKCGCKAGQYGKRCRHLVWALYLHEWRQQQQAKAQAEARAQRAATQGATQGVV